MNRGRASEVVLAVILAGLMVLSVTAAVIPGLGTGLGTEKRGSPAPIETPTVTPSELKETANNTTTTTGGATLTGTSSTSDEGQTRTNTTTPGVADKRLALRHARALLSRTATDPAGRSDNLTRAVGLATEGMKVQTAQLHDSDQLTTSTDEIGPTTPTPDHESPGAAAFAILNRYNVTPSAQQATNIRALDDLPEPTRSALTDVLDAYLGYYRATQIAYADANRTQLRAMANVSDETVPISANGSFAVPGNGTIAFPSQSVGRSSGNTDLPVESAGGLRTADVDVERMRAAQIRLLETTVAINKALSHQDAPGLTRPTSHDTVEEGRQAHIQHPDRSSPSIFRLWVLSH